MTLYITSDIHFFHNNIIKYCPDSRGMFNDKHEMNEAIVKNWNTVVNPDDDVYILGDISFGSVKDTCLLLDRLNGKKYLIRGNHDDRLSKDSNFIQRFEWVKDYHEMRIDKKLLVMSHYPFASWNSSHYGSFNFHGHLHSTNPSKLEQRRWDVGLDGNNLMVYNILSLMENIDRRLVCEPTVCHHNRSLE